MAKHHYAQIYFGSSETGHFREKRLLFCSPDACGGGGSGWRRLLKLRYLVLSDGVEWENRDGVRGGEVTSFIFSREKGENKKVRESKGMYYNSFNPSL